MPRVKELGLLSDGEIADSWGALNRRLDALAAQVEALKAEFDGRALDFAKGERFKVTKDVTVQKRLDLKMVRDALGADAKRFEKPQTRTAYLVRPVALETTA